VNSLSGDSEQEVFNRFLHDYDGDDRYVAGACCSMLLQRALAGVEEWSEVLPRLASAYKGGVYFRISDSELTTSKLPQSIAWSICRDQESYPMDLVAGASRALKSQTGAAATSLAKIAERDGWFSEEQS
jgi:hypothetical protein